EGTDPEFEQGAAEQITKLRSFEPTEDVMADIETFDRITGEQLGGRYRTPADGLRLLVGVRHDYRQLFARSPESERETLIGQIKTQHLAALDRLLAHHGVTQQTLEEY